LEALGDIATKREKTRHGHHAKFHDNQYSTAAEISVHGHKT